MKMLAITLSVIFLQIAALISPGEPSSIQLGVSRSERGNVVETSENFGMKTLKHGGCSSRQTDPRNGLQIQHSITIRQGKFFIRPRTTFKRIVLQARLLNVLFLLSPRIYGDTVEFNSLDLARLGRNSKEWLEVTAEISTYNIPIAPDNWKIRLNVAQRWSREAIIPKSSIFYMFDSLVVSGEGGCEWSFDCIPNIDVPVNVTRSTPVDSNLRSDFLQNSTDQESRQAPTRNESNTIHDYNRHDSPMNSSGVDTVQDSGVQKARNDRFLHDTAEASEDRHSPNELPMLNGSLWMMAFIIMAVLLLLLVLLLCSVYCYLRNYRATNFMESEKPMSDEAIYEELNGKSLLKLQSKLHALEGVHDPAPPLPPPNKSSHYSQPSRKPLKPQVEVGLEQHQDPPLDWRATSKQSIDCEVLPEGSITSLREITQTNACPGLLSNIPETIECEGQIYSNITSSKTRNDRELYVDMTQFKQHHTDEV